MKNVLLLFSLFIGVSGFAQLSDGLTAPDFTLTDYYGTEHTLYDYLAEGKTVFVEIFAAHCPGCWSYHQTNKLKNLYNAYGPEGTNEIMVLALEHDQWNHHNAFIGDGPPWTTQGNWLEETPYPIFDVEDPDRGVFVDYNVNFYPAIYKICPNRILERIMTNESEAELYEKVGDCQALLPVEEVLDLGNVYFNSATNSLVVDRFQKVKSVQVMNIVGEVVQTIDGITSPKIAVQEMKSGVYLFRFETDYGVVVKRFYVN